MNQYWRFVNWTSRNKIQWNFNRHLCIFIQENAFENVVRKTATILSRPHGVSNAAQCSSTAMCQANLRSSISTNVSMHYVLMCLGVVPEKCRYRFPHDDVIKWKHFPRYWLFVWGIHRSTVNFPHKGQWRGALIFSLICAWINAWVNNREAGDMRRHRAHCNGLQNRGAVSRSIMMLRHGRHIKTDANDPGMVKIVFSCVLSWGSDSIFLDLKLDTQCEKIWNICWMS